MDLTPRERVIAQIGHHETDHVPYVLSFEGDVADHLDEHFGDSDWRNLLDNSIRHMPAPNLVVDQTAGSHVTGPYGSLWRVNRRPFHLERPVLTEPSMAGYVFPDLDALFNDEWRAEAMSAIESTTDHFTVIGFGFGLFERTWALRGFNDALMDAAGDPGFYDELAEQVTVHQLDIIERIVELPVDGVMFSDDWGYQQGVLLGPERWRRFLKDRLARQYARVHEAGKYVLSHCCGSIATILPDLIEIGLDVYQSVQPEAKDSSPYELKRLFGDRMTFWGGLGSQSTISFGTPESIKAEVNRLCSEMGQGGGYILAPAKALQPETPTENAAAVVEAFLAQAGVALG